MSQSDEPQERIAAPAAAATANPGDPPPNVLFITTDDQGVQAGCYGDPLAQTPNLDALADQGIRFTRAYVTQASCSPSRSSMFTGTYPHENGQIGLAHRGYQMKQGMATMPAVLRQAGYFTGVIGKVHVRPSEAIPFDFRGTPHGQTRDVAKVAASAREFFDEAADRPFFFMVNYFDPHRTKSTFEDQVAGLPQTPYGPEDVLPFDFLAGVNTEQVRREVAGYYNCVNRVDVGLGMLLQALEESGHAENTLVIYIGDHGPPFTRAKTTCYEAGIHIPFVVRWPGRAQQGIVTDAMISTIDIMPTVLQAAGVDVPAAVTGRSLIPLLAGDSHDSRRTLCAEYNSHGEGGWFPRRSIRDDRYKLINNLLPDRPNPIKAIDGCAAYPASQGDKYDNTLTRKVMNRHANPPAVELYDLSKDPDELLNLAGQDEYADVETRLLAQLNDWRENTNDPLLDPEKLEALTDEHDGPG